MKATNDKIVGKPSSCNIWGRDLSESNMRVAYIVREFPSVTETFILREMYWIRREQIDISIFALYPPPNLSKPIQDQAKELLPNTHYSSFFDWNVIKAQLYYVKRSPFRYFRILFQNLCHLYREPGVLLRALVIFPKSIYFAYRMEEAGIQHIHAHFVWLEGIAARIIANILDVSYSIRPHAFGLFSRNQKNVRQELESASKIITISKFNQDYIAKLCPNISINDIEVVYCGLENNLFLQPSERTENTINRILSIGRFIEKKGHEYLIDACALLAERGIGFECKIAGGGSREKELRARIERLGLQDQVSLMGSQDQKQILELYRTSDIFVLACVTAKNGDQDGIPVVLMEAMACELPVITTTLSGIPDLISDEDNGIFVDERDPDGLARALELLIFDKNLRQQIGKRARQTIRQKFEVRHNVVHLAGIFRQVSQLFLKMQLAPDQGSSKDE